MLPTSMDPYGVSSLYPISESIPLNSNEAKAAHTWLPLEMPGLAPAAMLKSLVGIRA